MNRLELETKWDELSEKQYELPTDQQLEMLAYFKGSISGLSKNSDDGKIDFEFIVGKFEEALNFVNNRPY